MNKMDSIANAIQDPNQQQEALENPLAHFRAALKASRQLQSDGQRLGHDRVDLYYENVEGTWLEILQEDK
jgi:outer membrane murein-binding lipoprotein Lpp